jgi:hypothetical protein
MTAPLPALLAAFAALAFAVAPAPAAAGGGPGHCPPGLAKKNPPCIPPGQVGRRGGDRYDGHDDWDDDHHYRWDDDYDQAYRDPYRDGYRIGVGDRLTRGD